MSSYNNREFTWLKLGDREEVRADFMRALVSATGAPRWLRA